MQPLTRPTLYAAGLTGLWIVLAWGRPTVTYHLAPLLVAIVVPGAIALSEKAGWSLTALATGTGALLAAVATIVLGTTGHLAGPSLLPSGGAVVEAWVLAAVGAAGGGALAVVRR